jgi:hypothetical protein
VREVKDMSRAFSKHRNEAGGSHVTDGNDKADFFNVFSGLNKWKTGSVTSLGGIFHDAASMNAIVNGWDVSNVANLRNAFNGASSFVGNGLEKWITSAVKDLAHTFRESGVMDVDLGAWDVSQVTTMSSTFYSATKFVGFGLDKWDIALVIDVTDTFLNTNSLTPCNKHKIVNGDAWVDSAAFKATTYLTNWADDSCNCAVGEGLNAVKACAACGSGKYSNVDDANACKNKSPRTCTAGQRFYAGTTSADDSACVPCAAGQYLSMGDTTACKVKTVRKCSAGIGYTEGSASADDSACTACGAGFFSSSEGTDACVVHSSPPCDTGSGVAAGTATTDASCAPCGSGKYSVNTDSSPCTDNTCPLGKFLGSAVNEEQVCSSTCVAGKFSVEGGKSCSDCPSGTFSTEAGQSSCIGTPCIAGTSNMMTVYA